MATSAWSEAGVSEWAGRGMERLAAGWPDLAALVSRTGNNAVLESGVSLSRAAPAQGAGLAVGRRAGGRRGSARRARTGSRGTGARWRVRARRVPARGGPLRSLTLYTHVPSCVASDVCGGGPRKATRKIQKRDFSHASRRSATLAARPGPQTLVYTTRFRLQLSSRLRPEGIMIPGGRVQPVPKSELPPLQTPCPCAVTVPVGVGGAPSRA